MPRCAATPLCPSSWGWVPRLPPNLYYQNNTDMNTPIHRTPPPLNRHTHIDPYEQVFGRFIQRVIIGARAHTRFPEWLPVSPHPSSAQNFPSPHVIDPSCELPSYDSSIPMGVICYVHYFNCIRLVTNEFENLICQLTTQTLCLFSIRCPVFFLSICSSIGFGLTVVHVLVMEILIRFPPLAVLASLSHLEVWSVWSLPFKVWGRAPAFPYCTHFINFLKLLFLIN